MAKKVKNSRAPVVLQSKVPPDYPDFLKKLKSTIQNAQLKAAISVNLKMTSLYWDIGQRLLKKLAEKIGGQRWCNAWQLI